MKRNPAIQLLGQLAVVFVVLLGVLVWGWMAYQPNQPKEDNEYIYALDYKLLPEGATPENKQLYYGAALFEQTAQLLGEASKEKLVGNQLNCSSCHLDGGTKPYAIPLIGVHLRFPQYRGREDTMGTLEERINGCFERSMNGKKLTGSSPAMQALVRYITWLGRYVEPRETLTATGLKPINLPNRAVDLNHGQQVYKKVCVVCHGNQGEGQLGEDSTYEYPPLWGPMAYNNGAGMTRVITAAQFIKYNMPYGINYKTPQLTDAEAYDVAGYINQQSRPQKKNLAADFPNRLKKPVSTPYPPYADSFTQTQHALGPFQPIMEYYAKVHQITKKK